MEWDWRKAVENERKHGIRFSDVEPVFYDSRALTIENGLSEGEQRFVTIGMDGTGGILVVAYTYRGDSLRVISARRASRTEAQLYEKGV